MQLEPLPRRQRHLHERQHHLRRPTKPKSAKPLQQRRTSTILKLLEVSEDLQGAMKGWLSVPDEGQMLRPGAGSDRF
jgi:hypothetical protein